MKRGTLVCLYLGLLVSTPVAFANSQIDSDARHVGHATGNAAREIAHVAKRAGKTIGKDAKRVGKAVGHAARTGGWAFRNAFDGKGD